MPISRSAGPWIVVTVGLFAMDVVALQQPNGAQVPTNACGTLNCDLNDMCIGNVLECAGETIDAVAEASVEPQTFVPRGPVSIHLLFTGTANHCEFGWYNADDNVAEPVLHPFVNQCVYDADVGEIVTFNWCSDERWTGGPVGLFLGCYRIPFTSCEASSCQPDGTPYCHVFYTETARNETNGASGYIYGIRYASTASADKFYLAWEDWYGQVDSDFNDYVFSITGVDRGCKSGICSEGFVCDGFRCVPSTTCDADGGCPGSLRCDINTNRCSNPGAECRPADDGGIVFLDAGSPAADAGSTVADAGSPPVDSGNPIVDAAMPVDAAAPLDAARADASARDAGGNVVTRDAGRDAGAQGSADAGTGGDTDADCSCRASSSDVSAPWLLLFAMVLYSRRRR